MIILKKYIDIPPIGWYSKYIKGQGGNKNGSKI